MLDPLAKQVGGDHYKSMSIQPIVFCQANELNACESNIVKYVCRHKQKGRVKDLEKVIHYAQMLIELEYGEEVLPGAYLKTSKSTPTDEAYDPATLGRLGVGSGLSGALSVSDQPLSSQQLELPLELEILLIHELEYPPRGQWYVVRDNPSYLFYRCKQGNGIHSLCIKEAQQYSESSEA